MINHAITGYACFLSCRTLRQDFVRILKIIFHREKKYRMKSITVDRKEKTLKSIDSLS